MTGCTSGAVQNMWLQLPSSHWDSGIKWGKVRQVSLSCDGKTGSTSRPRKSGDCKGDNGVFTCHGNMTHKY